MCNSKKKKEGSLVEGINSTTILLNKNYHSNQTPKKANASKIEFYYETGDKKIVPYFASLMLQWTGIWWPFFIVSTNDSILYCFSSSSPPHPPLFQTILKLIRKKDGQSCVEVARGTHESSPSEKSKWQKKWKDIYVHEEMMHMRRKIYRSIIFIITSPSLIDSGKTRGRTA